MSKGEKQIVAILSILGLALLVSALIVNRGRTARADEDDEEDKPIQMPSRVSVQNGQAVITLDAAAQAHLGLKIETLRLVVARPRVETLAVVLPVDDLANARANYVAAQAKVESIRASLEAARKEDDRLKSLYQNQQGASLKALEAQDALLRSVQADMETAARALDAQAALARLQWGGVVGEWVRNGSPELDSVLNQQQLLVQVTLPPEHTLPDPPSVLLQAPSGAMLTGSAVSPYPRVDPRIQASSYLYRTAAVDGLTPGLSLVARLPVGAAAKGVVVPDAAAVWWQGMAWVYVQTSPRHFVRRVVSTNDHLENGWFTNSLSAGDKIVTVGAQSLLSEEFRSEIQLQE